jgi:hypothetical protein
MTNLGSSKLTGHSEEPASEDRVLLHDEIAYHAVHCTRRGGGGRTRLRRSTRTEAPGQLTMRPQVHAYNSHETLQPHSNAYLQRSWRGKVGRTQCLGSLSRTPRSQSGTATPKRTTHTHPLTRNWCSQGSHCSRGSLDGRRREGGKGTSTNWLSAAARTTEF